HRVLELTDFTALPDSPKGWEQSMARMVEQSRLALQQKDCISAEKLFQFGESLLAKRMAKAAREGRLRKEQAFFLGVPAGEVNRAVRSGSAGEGLREAGIHDEGNPRSEISEELVLIQGIIDAFFEEEDGAVLLDYKTDRVRNGQELADKYHTQMRYYTKAIEQALGKKVKEVILYSFCLGKEIFLHEMSDN
ncbi:MAG: PD-(D/E)XK nuclease family protein, partial [Lachnospiraceae bacterium]|nr:PD-(D/E)XK nuclease family protein [Lachnospiraceae bacterium]